MPKDSSLEFEQRVRSTFEELIEVEFEQRQVRLQEIRQTNIPLARALEDLLRIDSTERPSFLDRPLQVPAIAVSSTNYIGLQIGPYTLRELLGEGGTGVVYLAERTDGKYEGKVAIKLIRSLLGSQRTERQVTAERQILATLDHPNIARLLDGGTTETGVPYVVLEWVDGSAITESCDAHQTSLRDRLMLFRKVCDSVHYAHRRLVVHRDLKPSNILVTREGETQASRLRDRQAPRASQGLRGFRSNGNRNPCTNPSLRESRAVDWASGHDRFGRLLAGSDPL